MKIITLLIILIFIFACEGKKVQVENKSISDSQQQIIKTHTANTNQENLKNNNYYLVIGYFDKNNNLEKIEHYLNGKFLYSL